MPHTTWTPQARKHAAEYHTKEYRTNRKLVLDRAYGGICPFWGRDPKCGGTMYHNERLSVDHIVPVSRGGTSDLANLVACHFACNHRAGSRLGAKASNDKQGRGRGSRGGTWQPKPWKHRRVSRNSRVW